MIRASRLEKVYRADKVETTALDGIDLEICLGEFVAVMGPSGCGKSTLLNMFGLLDTPTSGHVYLGDRDVSNLPERARTRLRKGSIGFIFQSFNLIDELSVYENVELPLLYLKVPARERSRRVTEAMDRVRISHRHDRYPHQLSGGQQQRVAIARAIIAKPDLILADEPTGNLDSKNGSEVLQLFRELNQDGTTIVIVTHSPRDTKYCQRIIELFDGQVVGDRSNEVLEVDHAS